MKVLNLTSARSREFGHPKDRIARRHRLEGGIRMPVFGMALSRHSFLGRGVHLQNAILVYFAHFRILALHGEKRMTIKCVLLGGATKIVESLAKLFLQVVGHIILVAKEDHAALGDYATNG